MAETLTFDNEQATEVLTEEEQDSLEVGEQLQDAQEQLLAGKYKNAEDLEQAYIELQKKLGEDEDSDSSVDEPTTTDSDDPYASAYNDDGSVNYEEASQVYGEEISGVMERAGLDPWSISKHFHANNGEITSEMNGQLLAAGFSQASINSYLAGRAVESGYTGSSESVELSDMDVNRVQNTVGGEKEYNQMVEWASTNLDQGSIQAFDDVISSGNIQMINMAVQGLKAQYLMDQGYEGTLASGKAPKSSGSVFRSQAELVAAMDDVRYDKDPAYRADVLSKLDRSDISF